MHHNVLLALAGISSRHVNGRVGRRHGIACSHTLRRKARLCMADHYHSGSGEGSRRRARAAVVVGRLHELHAAPCGRFSLAEPVHRFTKAESGWSAAVEAPCRR
jgi:hypothetical protein